MNLDKKSKKLAYLLRHDKEGYSLGKITQDGWRYISELCKDYNYSLPELEEIVKNDSKGRYEFDLSHNKIRARQGHSIPVEIDTILEADPPEFLYHGTSDRFLKSIKEKGLIPGTRLYVHLSADLETAKKVGLRHGGNLVILKIRAADMKKNGIVFRISGNGVWLVPNVKPEYLKLCKGCLDGCKWSDGKEEYELGMWGIFCKHPENIDYVDELKFCELYESNN